MNIPDELVREFSGNNVTIFIGAGIAKMAGLPDWKDLVEKISEQLDEGGTEIVDFPEIADDYIEAWNEPELARQLKSMFSAPNCVPKPIHYAIARLPVSRVVVTYYDDLLEKAVTDVKREYVSVIDSGDESFLEYEKLQILKLLGDVKRSKPLVVMGTLDYDQFIINRRPLFDTLKQTLRGTRGLFLGYTPNDPDLQLILKALAVVTAEKEILKHYFTYNGPLPERELQKLEKRGFKCINIDTTPLSAFLTQLTQKSTKIKTSWFSTELPRIFDSIQTFSPESYQRLIEILTDLFAHSDCLLTWKSEHDALHSLHDSLAVTYAILSNIPPHSPLDSLDQDSSLYKSWEVCHKGLQGLIYSGKRAYGTENYTDLARCTQDFENAFAGNSVDSLSEILGELRDKVSRRMTLANGHISKEAKIVKHTISSLLDESFELVRQIRNRDSDIQITLEIKSAIENLHTIVKDLQKLYGELLEWVELHGIYEDMREEFIKVEERLTLAPKSVAETFEEIWQNWRDYVNFTLFNFSENIRYIAAPLSENWLSGPPWAIQIAQNIAEPSMQTSLPRRVRDIRAAIETHFNAIDQDLKSTSLECRQQAYKIMEVLR